MSSILMSYGVKTYIVRLIGAMVRLLAASRGSNCLLTRTMDGRIVGCGIVSSCQSAATSCHECDLCKKW